MFQVTSSISVLFKNVFCFHIRRGNACQTKENVAKELSGYLIHECNTARKTNNMSYFPKAFDPRILFGVGNEE